MPRVYPVAKERARFWTLKRDALLREFADKGQTAPQIGELLKTSRQQVACRAKQLRIVLEPAPDSIRSKQKLARMHAVPPRPTPEHVLYGQGLAPQRILEIFSPGYLGQKARVGIFELEKHHCRFPINQRGTTQYCGLERITWSSYCADHSARCEGAAFRHQRARAGAR